MLKLHPFVWSEHEQDYELRQKKDKENRFKRQQVLDDFIKDENSIGWLLKDKLDDLNRKMTVEHVTENVDDAEQYKLVPSFFKVIQTLREKGETFPKFKIVFRTFGIDHNEIYEEFADFLYGKHPYFKNENPIPEPPTTPYPYINRGNIIRSHSKQSDIALITNLLP